MSDRGRSPGPSGSGPGSGPRGPSGSRGSSPASAAGRGPVPQWKEGPGYDPARMDKPKDKGNTRMELPPDAYATDAKKSMFAVRGNKFNTEGTPDLVHVNQYRMKKFDFNKKVYQYDVSNSPLLFNKTS